MENFILPEKWCVQITKETISFYQTLDKVLGFDRGYPYTIGAYYTPFAINGINGFTNLPYNRTLITYEQFLEHVIKEKTKFNNNYPIF